MQDGALLLMMQIAALITQVMLFFYTTEQKETEQVKGDVTRMSPKNIQEHVP